MRHQLISEGGTYRDLEAWKRGVELAALAYEFAKNLPQTERYGMCSQVQRSAASVPANVAEGYGRDSDGDFVRSLRIAQGSLKELETHVLVCVRVGLIDADRTKPILEECDRVGKIIRGLIRWLQSKDQ